MNRKKNILIVFGTRPEVIKMAPVILELRKRSSEFVCNVCATAQHRSMQDQALQIFSVEADYDLNIMKPGQSLGNIVSRLLIEIERVVDDCKPGYVLVQGDTATAFSAGLAAFHKQVPVVHIEAGLRTYRKHSPYPEEVYRHMLSAIAELHCAPTKWAQDNLLREGVPGDSIVVTGNTIIDALNYMLKETRNDVPIELACIHSNASIILVTSHRRESFGSGFREICKGIREIAVRYPSCHVVYPVHLNPNIQGPAYTILGGLQNVSLLKPMAYLQFIHLMKRANLIITDSGGIQEEATALEKPVIVTREVTERPEAIEAGVCKLVGTSSEQIYKEAIRVLNGGSWVLKKNANSLYGSGCAAQAIADAILRHSGCV